MAQRFTLSIRRTHGYVGTWRHLDKWDEIGSAEVIATRAHEIEDNGYSHVNRINIVCVSTDAPPEDIKEALYSEFSSHGCSHEYDCCGCWSTSARTVRRLGPDRYAVLTSSSQNY